MSDETVHYAREAVIRHDGRGEVRDAEGAEAITAADADDLRAAVMQRVIEFATDVGAPVNLRVADVDGIYRLVVHPGGRIMEEGGFEPLGPGDDVLWSSGGAGGDGAADGDAADDLADDDGGYHDEALDSDVDALGDEPIDGDFEVPVGMGPASAGGGSGSAAPAPGAAPGDARPASPAPDGGYADMFGLGDGETETPGDATTAADLHETIQLPRPGMMREEPPAVTGLQPIVPPSGARFGAPHSDEEGDGDDGLDGDDLLAAELEDDDEFVDDGAASEADTDDEADVEEALEADAAFERDDAGADAWGGPDAEAGWGAEGDDDSVVADWGTGGLDVVTGGIAMPRPGAAGPGAPAGEPGADGAAGSVGGDTPSRGAPLPWAHGEPQGPAEPHSAPAAPAGGDAYGLGGRSAPEWSPRFPRSAAQAAPADGPTPAAGPGAGAGAAPWLAPAPGPTPGPDAANAPGGPNAPAPAHAQGGWPQHGAPVGGDGAPAGHAPDARGVSAAPAASSAPSSTRGIGPTLGDFLADNTTRKDPPASRGWRAGLRRGTGGLLKLGPGARERAEREEIAMIQKPLDGPKTVVVVNPKGGAHKTTTTLMIAAMFGMHRGGYTLAWDNNETRGTLGWRSHRGSHQRTAVDLLRQLSHFEISGGATIADIDRFVRNQGTAKFDVLASDDDAASAAIIDADAFWRLHRTLSRFYRVVVIDTGNNMRASNWEAALELADQLVIVSTAREDTAASAAWLADGLRERGYTDKLAKAVTILSSPSTKEDPQLQARLRDHFAQLTRAVVEVPYDEEFVGGGELNVEQLRPETRDAWRHVAAVIAQGL